MDINQAMTIFDTLSQETRLRAFRLLVESGPAGLAAGAISDQLGTPQNTMSFHLNHLTKAGVVSAQRQGRSIIYRAHYEMIRELIGFMVQDCCRDDAAKIWNDEDRGCCIIELADCCASDEVAS